MGRSVRWLVAVAVVAAGLIVPSGAAQAVGVPVVTNIGSSAVTETGLTLTWTNPDDAARTAIVIRRSTGFPAPVTITDGVGVATLAPSVVTWTDSGLTPGTTYSYSIFTQDAGANSPASWIETQTTPRTWTTSVTEPPRGTVTQLSCPTPSFCMVGDDAGYAVRVVNAHGVDSTRLVPNDDYTDAITAMACRSSTFCVAGGAHGEVFRYNGSAWSAGTTLFAGDYVSDIACVSTTFCIAVDGRSTGVYNGSTWSVHPTAGAGLQFITVACASASMCVAIGYVNGVGNYAYVWRGSTWSHSTAVLNRGGDEVLDSACPSVTYCRVVTDDMYVLRFNGTTWTKTTTSGDAQKRESCPAVSYCMEVRNDGFPATSFSAYNGTTATKSGVVMSNAGRNLNLSCPTTTWCLFIDELGDARTWNGSAWSAETLIDRGQGGLGTVSCASASMCVALDGFGNYSRYDGTAWTTPSRVGISVPLLGPISCLTTTFCLTTDAGGRLLRYNGSSWSLAGTASLASTTYRLTLSCASVTFCMIVSADTGKYQIFNGTSLSAPVFVPGLSGSLAPAVVSCTPSKMCAVVGGSKKLSVYRSGAWLTPLALPATTSTDDYFVGLSCVGTAFCIVLGDEGTAAVYNGTAVHAIPPAARYVSGVSCTGGNDCVSTTGGSVQTWNGTYWNDPQPVGTIPPQVDALDLSCVAGTTTCVGVGFWGAVVGR